MKIRLSTSILSIGLLPLLLLRELLQHAQAVIPELVQILLNRLETLPAQIGDAARLVFLHVDEPGIPQDLQMLGYRGLADAEQLAELSRRAPSAL
jgi:hypothetical protein